MRLNQHRTIRALNADSPPASSVTRRQRLGADLIDVVRAWWRGADRRRDLVNVFDVNEEVVFTADAKLGGRSAD
jgi:hypothetical protein